MSKPSPKTPVVGRKPGSLIPTYRTYGWGKTPQGKFKVGLVVDSRPPASKIPQLRAINDDRRPGAPDSLNTIYPSPGRAPFSKVRRMRKSPVR